MKRRQILLYILLSFSCYSYGQNKISYNTYRKVLQLPDSVSIGNSCTLYNIFKLQVITLYKNQLKSESVLKKAILQNTYTPFESFWRGYVGDADTYFTEIIKPLKKDSIKLIETKANSYSTSHVDRLFKKITKQIKGLTGYTPSGKWYLAFGSGITDMGGFGGGKMVVDLTHHKTSIKYLKLILPHEITHQIFSFTNQEDTTARGLYRCINEGLAVYMNKKLLGTQYSLTTYLQYTENELNYCITNESVIFKKLKPYLLTNNPDHALALADRGQKIFKEGPGAIGYFIGYQICASYVKNNGPNSWKDLFREPVVTILNKSQYN